MQEPSIKRVNLLRAINTSLRSQYDVVFVDGPPGVGVTTLLQQLAEESSPVVSLFLRNGTRIGYDPRLVLCRLVDGLSAALGEVQTSATYDEAQAALPLLLNKLARRAIHRFSVLFIVDGLHQIPSADAALRAEINEFLPLGQPGCKFVVAGTATQLAAKSLRRLEVTVQTVPGFTLDEAKTFLSDRLLDQGTLETIWNNAGCNPSVLASVGRLLDGGTRSEQLSDRLCDDPSTLFMAEWDAAELSLDAKRCLAVCAFHDSVYTLSDLANVARQPLDLVSDALRPLRFLTIGSNGEVAFVSPFFHEFARKQLAAMRATALDCVIRSYQSSPDSKEALSSLPSFLTQQGRAKDLLDYLSPARFPSVVQASGSAATVHQATTSAAAAARELRLYGELVRFSVHAATLANIHATKPPDAEVKALLALGRFEEARAVAESATVAEDRLQLLAKVGRALGERGMAPDARLTALISDLCAEMDFGIFGERGMELAEDLLFVSPSLGLKLLDKVAQNRRNDEESAWAFADLAVEAAKWSKKNSFPSGQLRDLNARISDPEAKLTAVCRAQIYSRSSGEEIVAEARGLSRAGDGLRLLASWVTANRSHKDVLFVVKEALSWLTATLDYTPGARLLRQLASALPGKSDPQLPHLVSAFDALKAVAEKVGPSSEYIRLQCALAHAEWEYNRQESSSRLMQTAVHAADLLDPATRAAAFAAVASRLFLMDPDRVLDVSDHLHELAVTEAARAIDATLKSTAEPHVTLAGTLQSLVHGYLDLAISTVERFNSVDRTEVGLLMLAFAASSTTPASLAAVARLVAKLGTSELRGAALVAPFEKLFELESLSDDQRREAEGLLTGICQPDTNVLTLARGARLATRHGLSRGGDLLSHISQWSQGCERTSDAVETHFELTAVLADTSPEVASGFFASAIALRTQIPFPNALRSETFEFSVRLATKALRSLFKGNRETEQNLSDIAETIAELPSRSARIRRWTEVALGFADAGRLDECRRVREDWLRGLLDDAKSIGGRVYDEAVVEAIPALFRCHSTSALELVRALPSASRDRAIRAVTHHILHGLPPHEPCSPPLDGVYDLSYEEVVDLLALSELVDCDSTCYQMLKNVCTSMVSDKYRNYSREQKTHTSSRAVEIARAKFPRPRYVSHAGYGIAARAQALRLVQSEERNWQALAAEGRAVDNAADVPLILMMIAGCVPSKFKKYRDGLYKDARAMIEVLESVHDRLQRLIDLANSLRIADRASAKETIRAALALCRASKERALPSPYMVEAVHRIDPDASETLAAICDDDPARAGLRKRLRKELEIRELAGSIRDLDSERLHDGATGEAAWLALADLNAGQSTPLQSADIWRIVEMAGAHPLEVSFPMLSLALTSAAKQFAGTDQSAMTLRAIFDGALTAAKVLRDLSCGNRERRASLERGTREASVLVRVGERANAVSWLEEWSARCVLDEVIVCDPYFGLKDLESIRILTSCAPAAKVRIITSRIALANIPQPWEQSFRDHWRQALSNSEPPDTEILVVGVGPQGKSPIHDRWWLAGDHGLRLGTSFNGFGLRESEISELNSAQCAEVRELLDFYLRRERHTSRDSRIAYSMFSL